MKYAAFAQIPLYVGLQAVDLIVNTPSARKKRATLFSII